MNDGSCRFPESQCAIPLVQEPFVARGGRETWQVAVNRSTDGSSCAIGPAVPFDTCLSLVPPPHKSTDAILTFVLPKNVVEVTVEVGLSPRAGRYGSVEFELRLVSKAGDVVASELIVRTRRGAQIPPALLRVARPEAQRGMTGILLQLVANNEDGDSGSDIAVWGNPLLYCDSSCDQCGTQTTIKHEETDVKQEETQGPAASSLQSPLERLRDVEADPFTIGVAIAVFAVSVSLLLWICGWICGCCANEGRRTSPDDVASQAGRVIGEVNIMRRKRSEENGERLSLVGAAAVEEDEAGEDAERHGATVHIVL